MSADQEVFDRAALQAEYIADDLEADVEISGLILAALRSDPSALKTLAHCFMKMGITLGMSSLSGDSLARFSWANMRKDVTP